MAYEDGIISIKTVGGVSYGVSVYDVQRALGRGTPDVGQLCSDQEWYLDHIDPVTNEPVYLLRRVGKTNRWAKYKSIRLNKLGVLTDADRASIYFGLDVTPTKGGAANLASFLSRYPTEWAYLPPRGKGNGESGADEWFRMLDFNGYNRNANCFINISDIIFPGSTVVGQSSLFRIGLNSGVNLNTGSIGIADLRLNLTGDTSIDFNDLYGGLLFVQGTSYKLITSPYKLGEQNQQYVSSYGTEITVPAFSSTGTYTVYPVFSSNKYLTLSDTGNTDDIVAVPLIGAKSFTIVSEQAVENIFISNARAVMGSGRYSVSFVVALGGTAYDSIYYTYEIREATGPDDRSGTLVRSSSSNPQLVQGSPQSVGPQTIMGSIQGGWVYIKAYDSAREAVYAEAWAQIEMGELLD